MKGMLKPLWVVFCVVIIVFTVWRSPLFVLEVAAIIFVGGGLFLTVFSYACAKWSMPRKATDYLPDSGNSGNIDSPKRTALKFALLILAYLVGAGAAFNFIFREHERPEDYIFFAAALVLWLLARDRWFPAQWRQALSFLNRRHARENHDE